jgi:hypothetical protein
LVEVKAELTGEVPLLMDADEAAEEDASDAATPAEATADAAASAAADGGAGGNAASVCVVDMAATLEA